MSDVENFTGTHVILVALDVTAPDRATAHATALQALAPVRHRGSDSPLAHVDSWWIAEDDRTDRSDNDSAVFVTPGQQAQASQALHALGLTPKHNLVNHTAIEEFRTEQARPATEVDQLLRDYDEWLDRRADISYWEETGQASPDEWHDSDDEGCDLASRLADALRNLTGGE